MIAAIAKKEFVCLVRDGRFRWIAAIMALLLLASLWTGYSRYQSLKTIQAVAQATTEEQWVNQGDKNPHTAAHFGNYAFKVPGPLSFFDSVISSYVGSTIWLEAHKTNFAKNRPAQDNGGLSRFGELTPAMVLQLLIPLMLILFGFSAFAGERDAGTLRQLVSLGAGGNALLWGKLLGVAGAMAVILLPYAVICGIVLVFVGGDGGGELGTRGWLLFVFYLLYASMYDEFQQFVYYREEIMGLVRRVLVPLVILLVISIALYPRRINVAGKSSSRAVAPADGADTRLGGQGVRSS